MGAPAATSLDVMQQISSHWKSSPCTLRWICQCLLNYSIIGNYLSFIISMPAELFNYRYLISVHVELISYRSLLLYQCLLNYSISIIFYYISACWTIQLYWYFLLYLCLLDYSNTCIIGIILLWRHLRKKIFFGKHVVWSAAEIPLVPIKWQLINCFIRHRKVISRDASNINY